MGKVVSHMTMSLDGFVADPHDGVAESCGRPGALATSWRASHP